TPGVVESVDGEAAKVRARPLLWDGWELALGEPEPRDARWRDDGLAFVPDLRPGDRVSMHWDFVCDHLSPRAERSLEQATRHALGAGTGTAAIPPVLASVADAAVEPPSTWRAPRR